MGCCFHNIRIFCSKAELRAIKQLFKGIFRHEYSFFQTLFMTVMQPWNAFCVMRIFRRECYIVLIVPWGSKNGLRLSFHLIWIRQKCKKGNVKRTAALKLPCVKQCFQGDNKSEFSPDKNWNRIVFRFSPFRLPKWAHRNVYNRVKRSAFYCAIGNSQKMCLIEIEFVQPFCSIPAISVVFWLGSDTPDEDQKRQFYEFLREIYRGKHLK